MPDTNMNTIYNWARQLCDVSELNITMDDRNEVTNLIVEINNILGKYIENDKKSNRTGLFEHFSKNTKNDILNHVDDLFKQYKFTFKSKEHGQSFGLRLWSGCISAAKSIAPETMNGQNTHKLRSNLFRTLDRIANKDPIFKFGIECAPLFKKHHQQYYSFDGVPLASSVRNYPNEYLIDNNGIV